jgi:hypothetical protein
MGHLQLVAIELDPARDEPDAALWQLPLDEFALGTEEHQVEAAAVVLGRDPVWRLVVAARRRPMLEDAQLQGGNSAWDRAGDGWLGATVDHAGRGMPDEVDDARPGRWQPYRLLEQGEQARPDAGERRAGPNNGVSSCGADWWNPLDNRRCCRHGAPR